MTMQEQMEQIVNADGNFTMTQLANVMWPLIEALPNVSRVVLALRPTLGAYYRRNGTQARMKPQGYLRTSRRFRGRAEIPDKKDMIQHTHLLSIDLESNWDDYYGV